MKSLRRSLAVRFAGTMLAGLLAIAVVTWLGERELFEADNGVVTGTLLFAMLGTMLLASFATLVGAYSFADAAIAPVDEITAQATTVTSGRTGVRITAQAGVEEFATLVTVLNDMLARLERADQWHRRIIRDLGHDLRTPLTALRAGVELSLRTERSPEEYRRMLMSILEEVDQLALIGESLALLGQAESGDLKLKLGATDLCTVAIEAIRRVHQRATDRRVQITAPDATVLTRGDAWLLGVALDQLLDNAVRHTPARTNVRVTTGVTGEDAELVVEDDGPGVPAEVLPHLFERFYRGDAARGRSAGPGLGLTVAATIVELHGGTIQAEHGASGGILVRIRLPLDTAPGGAIPRRHTPSLTVPA
jgi:two-component system OmpR family sensor kinase